MRKSINFNFNIHVLLLERGERIIPQAVRWTIFQLNLRNHGKIDS